MNPTFTRQKLRRPLRWLEAGLDLLFPPECAGCGTAQVTWCAECDQRLLKLAGRLCETCGTPEKAQRPCPICSIISLPLQVRSYVWYEGPVVEALLLMKYQPNRKLASRMGAWLHEISVPAHSRRAHVIPVPLGEVRKRERGYNQAELIASEFAEISGRPYSSQALRRVRETRSQVGLNLAERQENVFDAFEADPQQVSDEVIMLVDDLFTTGATLSACAKALHRAGADSVVGLSVARARPRRHTPSVS